MSKKQFTFVNILLVLILSIFLFEIVRDSFRDSDFIGYLNVGNLVLNHKDIYSDYLNTWPPLFSIFCVPLSLLDKVSPFAVRFLWLTGTIIALFTTLYLLYKIAFGKKPALREGSNTILLQDPIIVIPGIILLRFILENLANLQVNIYLLLAVVLSIYCFIKNNNIFAGLLLALTISLKVYTVYMLLYLIFKRQYKPVLWTFFFMALCVGICTVVFGYDQAISYYKFWYTEIVGRGPQAHHKNQSLFGFMQRLLSNENPGLGFHINVSNLPIHTIEKITYLFVAFMAIIPVYLFRKPLTNKSGIVASLEYAFIFTIIPILVPISWKAYYIFLYFPYILVFTILFRTPATIKKSKLFTLKLLFYLSILLTVFTTDGLIGRHLSDLMQVFSCVVTGAVLLAIVVLILYKNIVHFDVASIQFIERE
jgi:hypothetical protein